MRYESVIVWLEDIEQLDYVRVINKTCGRRRGSVKWKQPGRLIGYAELVPDAPHNGMNYCFNRRVFYLDPRDREFQPDGMFKSLHPTEAVDPRTLAPNEPGIVTPRVVGT